MRKIYNFINMLVVFIALSCSGTIYADEAFQVFSGAIGNQPIVMEFIINQDHSVSGNYFYRKHLMDIPLDGELLPDGSLQLGESRGVDINGKDIEDPDSDKHVDMVLHRYHQGWQGIWTGHDPKKLKHLAIHLSPLSSVKDAHQLDPNLTSYDQERISGLTLRKQELEHFGKYDIQWWIEPKTKIRLFRVIKGYPADTMLRINAVLASEQLSEIDGALSCPDDNEQYVLELSFMNERIISIRHVTMTVCGLNYPNGNIEPINLDVKTGKELNLEDVFWLENPQFKAPMPRDEYGMPANNDYEHQILGPWLFKTMTELHPKEISNTDENGCNYNNNDLWEVSAWYMTAEGLAFTPFMGSAGNLVCGEPSWAIIPWAIVNQHQGRLNLSLP